MSKDKIKRFADKLYNSQKDRVAISPITDEDNTLNIDDAYAIQMTNVERVVKEGHVISGKKIGLTSKGIQEQMGVSEPDYGHLFKAMDHFETGVLNTSDFLEPKIEGELAFILKEDLSGGKVTAEQVLQSTDYVVAAFEIVDSRVENWNIKLIDTVADNASSGCYILGDKKLKPSEVDLLEIEMELYKNGELLTTGNSKAVLGNPAEAVAWLANRLWNYGVTLYKGEIVLSGAFSYEKKKKKGDEFKAEFTHFGSVTANFE